MKLILFMKYFKVSTQINKSSGINNIFNRVCFSNVTVKIVSIVKTPFMYVFIKRDADDRLLSYSICTGNAPDLLQYISLPHCTRKIHFRPYSALVSASAVHEHYNIETTAMVSNSLFYMSGNIFK